MEIIIGAKTSNTSTTEMSKDDILYQSDGLVIGSNLPLARIELDADRTLLLQGEVYSMRSKNGDTATVDLSVDGKRRIAQLFENENLDQISARLEGDFVGVLLDGKGQFQVFGDEFNRTEIFYSYEDNETIFSTDLELICRLKDEITYDQASLVNLLSVYGYYAPKKQTIYKNISRLGVGESCSCDGTNLQFTQREFNASPIREYGRREHELYERNFREAILKRSSDTCNWVYLSSGWDSTSILAMLVDIHGPSKVKPIIGEMKYSERAGTINQFEIDRARKVTDYYGVPLEIVPFDLCNQDSIDYWKNLAGICKSQHVYSSTAYNFSRLYDHVKLTAGADDAVFAGEISDGVHNLGFSQFATILEHPDLSFREYSDKMASYLFGPSFLQSIKENSYASDAVYKLLRSRLGEENFSDENLDTDGHRMYAFLTSFFLRNSRIPFYGPNGSRMINSAGANLLEEEIGEQYLRDAAEKITPDNVYSWLLYLYNSFYWQGGTVRAFGAKCHADGKRLRLPFWDSRIQDFLSTMPEDWGRGLELKPTKYPLKWMLENKIDYPMHLQTGPHSYLYDVNPTFSHAGELLFASHLSNHIKDILKSYPYEEVLSNDYFDLDYLRKIVDSYLAGTELMGGERNDLMSIATLCIIGWY